MKISFASEGPVLSDNYFDIATRDAVAVLVKTETDADALLSDMRLFSVYDIPAN